MAIGFNITIGEEELLEKWSEQVSVDKWIEMYKNLSDSYSSWDIDLQLAEFIVKRVKENFIDKYLEEDVPEVLSPLLLKAISNDIKEKNKTNKTTVLEDTAGEHEFEAIKQLREYENITYEDALNIFCNGYDFAKESVEVTTDLSKVSTEALLKEVKNRM